jgi:hypothetical protein
MKSIISIFLFFATACGSHAAIAAFNANVTGINFSYTSQQSAYTVNNIVTPLAGFDPSSGYIMLCFDFRQKSFWELNGNATVTNKAINTLSSGITINTNLAASSVFDDTPLPQGEGRAIAQAGWLIDNFFVNKFVNGNDITRAALAQVIWEITQDGGTTGVNLDFTANDFVRNTGVFATGTALRTEMELMKNAVAASGVTSTYTWTTVHYLINDSTAGNQDYLLLKAPVPEAGSSLLIVLLTTTGLMSRRRSVKCSPQIA